MKNILAVLFIALSAASDTQAAKYTIDKDHSSVMFKIRHLTGKTDGAFTDFAGTFEFDEKQPAKSSVEATIQIASVDTRNAKRDGHLRTADFFDVEKFPAMTYKSTKVTSAGKNKFKVLGTLSMHGVEKPVTLNVEYFGEAKAKDAVVAGFSATGKLNRKDFGVGGLMLGEDVEIFLEVEAVKQ